MAKGFKFLHFSPLQRSKAYAIPVRMFILLKYLDISCVGVRYSMNNGGICLQNVYTAMKVIPFFLPVSYRMESVSHENSGAPPPENLYLCPVPGTFLRFIQIY